MIGYTSKLGFTLVEVVVAIAIMGLIIGSFSTLFIYFFRSFNFNIDQGQNIEEAKVALARLTTELREAQISDDGAYPLITTSDQELTFYANVDNDPAVERVRYFVNGTTFNRGVVQPANPPLVYNPANETTTLISTYIRNGTNPVFYYYNSNWPGDTINNPLIPAQRLLDTRLIRVEIAINTNTAQQQDFILSNQVMLRNLKTN